MRRMPKPERMRPVASNDYDTFEAVQSRLDEIVEAVGDENLSLDDALALYEEAVNLGLRGSDLLEENIEAFDARQAVECVEGEAVSDASGDAGAHETDGMADAPTVQVADDEEPQTVAGGIR